jgi:hypothetical protein
MSADVLLQIVIGLGAAGAVYGGIRADLRHHAEKIQTVTDTAQRAHERLDAHIEHAHGR